MADWDDKRLMKRFMAGEEDAFKEVYDRYYERLFTSAYRIVENIPEAEDIAVETLTRLFERHTKFQSIGQVQKWLFVTARNDAFDILRLRKTRKARDKEFRAMNAQEIESHSVNDELDIGLLEKVMPLVGELPPRSQQVIRLYYMEKLKYKEIAERLHISPRTVENMLRFALGWLKSRLGPQKLVFVLFLLKTLGDL